MAQPGARPIVPAWRRVALRVGAARSRGGPRAICENYELPYRTGPLFAHLGAVQRTILRLVLPGGTSPGRSPAATGGFALKLWPAKPSALGATYDGVGTNFAAVSDTASVGE